MLRRVLARSRLVKQSDWADRVTIRCSKTVTPPCPDGLAHLGIGHRQEVTRVGGVGELSLVPLRIDHPCVPLRVV